jgi:hypothetical protein
LSTFSKYDVTSPILRGAFITGRVLGVNPGTPDPALTNTPIPPGSYTTMREAIEALTANEPCHFCHGVNSNPPGFVLEYYGSAGERQDADPLGGTIDGAVDVRFSAIDTKTITSPFELMTEIGNLPESKYYYAEQWVALATGRVPNQADACTVNQLSSNVANDASYLGTEPVSCYGKYDDSSLFGGGGTAPAQIKNPGEYAQLLAGV